MISGYFLFVGLIAWFVSCFWAATHPEEKMTRHVWITIIVVLILIWVILDAYHVLC